MQQPILTPQFDNTQKKDGTNKYGHYQFGINTCQYCKNEDTELVEKIDGVLYFECFMCNATWNRKQ